MLARCSSLRRAILAGAFAVLAFPASAAEVAGVKFDDRAQVGGQPLLLNGAGVRTKVFIKVYAAGLYLSQPAASTEAVLASPGARRLTLVMLRDVTSDTMGQSLMDGLNHNSTKAEKTKVVNQMQKFGEAFATMPELKKGDVVHLDWLPGVGTQFLLNDRKVSEPFPDVAFQNALMRIWIGDNPADAALKPLLLGFKPSAVAQTLR